MKHVESLEFELGVKLFERSNRGAAPTKAGLALAEDARQPIRLADAAAAHAREAAGAALPAIHVGTSPLRPCKPLVDIWTRVGAGLPFDVRIVPFEDGRLSGPDPLDGQIDCFVEPCDAPSWREACSILELGSYRCRVGVPISHPLAAHSSLAWDTLSYQRDNLLTIREGELYLGQPFTGYALRGNPDEEVTIVGVLIRKETFYESFTPMAAGTRFLDFFIDPLIDPAAEQFMVLHPGRDFPIAELLGFMVCEYAHERADTQALLKSYALLLIMHAARQHDREFETPAPKGECAKMLAHLARNVGQVSLGDLAAQFGYHPNYLSTLFKKELGRSFTEVVLEQRMRRAAVLLQGTSMPVDKISQQLGYSNPSNFYKAFEKYYGCTPRDYPHAAGSRR